MKTSESAKKKISEFEGMKLTAYKCPAGVWTIGVGHTAGVMPGMKITEAQSMFFLSDDLRDVERNINSRFPVLPQNKFDAFVSLSFNIGIHAFNTSTLYRKAKSNLNDSSIRAEFLKWTRCKGAVLPGLLKRRGWEADLYFQS